MKHAKDEVNKMLFEQFILIILVTGGIITLYLEHRFISDMKLLTRFLVKKWKEKK